MPNPLITRFALVLALLPAAALALEARVVVENGAPRILIDGKPVRPRMFWGAPGSMPVRASAAGEVVAFEFVPDQDCDTTTLHLRFGDKPGEVFVDKLAIADLDAKTDVLPVQGFEEGEKALTSLWNTWPVGSANTVGKVAVAASAGVDNSAALKVTLANPPGGGGGGHWPDFHLYTHAKLRLVKGHRIRVSLWLKGTPARDVRIALYRPGQSYTYLGGPGDPFSPQIKLAANVGVDFVSFPVDLPWPAPGRTADFTATDAACQRVLAANPRALLIPRVPMDPPNWWRAAHLNQVMAWEDGTKDKGHVVPGAAYLRDATARLEALVKHLESKYGDRIAGYHPCGQNTGEWFYHDTWKRELSGFAPADRDEFRAWLKAHYPTDAALQKAWNRPDVTRDTADVPAAKARHAAPSGLLRDPSKERDLLDFAQFQQDLMANAVCELAKTVRTATGGKKLVLFFYGYSFEFGAIGGGAGISGHYAMRRALSSPDIDILCSPISYFDRGLSESGPAMTAAESVALAGKMWLYEDDTSTHISSGTPPGSAQRVKTIEQSNSLLARNTAQEIVRNFGCWWMDLTAAGWFNDPKMWAIMKALAPMDQHMLKTPTPYRPDIAAIIDERSMLLLAGGGSALARQAIYEVRRPLARCGAPYGQYFLDDVAAGKVPARVYVFLNAWWLSAPQRQDILKSTRGALRIWCGAAGAFDDSGLSLESMQQLTGFKLKRVTPARALAEPTARGKALGLTQPIGVAKPIAPLFAAEDATPDETLATYPDGSAAVALRKTPEGQSLFVGPPGLSSELVRVAAEKAGVHLYTKADCNVWANGPFIVLHTCSEGPLLLRLPGNGMVKDALTGQPLGVGPTLQMIVAPGRTMVLEQAPK